MKTIKTEQVLTDLKGNELEEGKVKITTGLLFSNILSQVQTSNPHRAYQLAKLFSTEKTVELKAEDIIFIKDHIVKSSLGSLYIGQLIDILEA